ncbi:MAG: phage tail protein [Fervidobacterium sp.]|nr:phage tail protein [Fervidobacterium sp.]
MYAQLGDIKFELITYYNSLEESLSVNYAEHNVIEGKPRLQFIGDNLETIKISLNFHASFCKPEEELKKLKEAMLKHEALPFVFGNGLFKGKYVITELTGTQIQTFKDGTVMSITANITLKEWVEDKALEIKKAETGKATGKKAKKQPAKQSKTQTQFEKGQISRKQIVRQQ